MSKNNEQKYFVVDSKYVAHAINIMTGIKFYQFTNEEGKTKYTFPKQEIIFDTYNLIINTREKNKRKQTVSM